MSHKRKDQAIIPSIQKGVRKAWQPLAQGTSEWWRDYRRWIHEPPSPGEASIKPSRVRARSLQTLVITFQVGEGGIAPYGHIAIECPPHRALENLMLEVPGTGRRGKALITASCSREEPELEITYSGGIIDVMIKEYPLAPGDLVTVTIGDERGYPARMPKEMQRYPFPIAVDAEADGIYHRIAAFPVLEVVGDCAARFQVTANSIQKANEGFSLTVLAGDKWNVNPDADYKGTAETLAIEFLCTDPEASLPSSYQFCEKDKGMHTFSGIKLRSPGVHTITVSDKENSIIGSSNPISIGFFDSPYNLYFGDIHGHNVNDDGRGTLEEYYHWAKEVRKLDFSALTNHAEGAKRFEVEDFWKEVQEAAKKYNQPHRFVAFLAFEWGGWDLFGDKCVYYLDDDQPYYAANDERSKTPKGLWQCLRDKNAITIPHHPKYGGMTDWSYHDAELQPLVEIYSVWGNSEKGREHSVQSAWARGYRLGVIASSDNHIGQPGNPNNGLAAVWARELTRESLFEALKSRRCYATTGERILLSFQVDGHLMGEEYRVASAASPRHILIKAAGTCSIAELCVVKSNVDLFVYRDLDKTAEIETIDTTPIRETDYYYVRITQQDGQMAWSSPIWVSL